MAKRKKVEHTYPAAERTKALIEPRQGESDIDYYYRLAKMADERMRKLEVLAGARPGKEATPGYENVLSYAYSYAIRDIKSYGGEGKMRFNVKPPENPRLFKEKIMDMRRFLSAPTSSKGGIKETYEARVKTINKTYGTNYTWEDLADFFQSGDADKLFKDYGSQTVMKAIGVIQYTADQVKEKIEENKNLKSSVVTNTALDIMQSPKYQRTQLRKSMSSEQRKQVREELKKRTGTKKASAKKGTKKKGTRKKK